MVSIDDRIQFTGKNLDKIQKQVEECNSSPLEHDLGWIPEQNLLHNYGSATLQLEELRKDLYSTQPGILTSKRDLRSRYEKLGKDFSKSCICTKSQ